MNRTVGLALALILTFLITVTILLQVMPGPHRPTDYLVIGAVATFLCILLLLLITVKTSAKPK